MVKKISLTILANCSGPLFFFAAVPLIIDLYSIEGFGSVSIMMTIFAMSHIFDLGLPILSMKFIANSTGMTSKIRSANKFITISFVYTTLLLIVGLSIFFLWFVLLHDFEVQGVRGDTISSIWIWILSCGLVIYNSTLVSILYALDKPRVGNIIKMIGFLFLYLVLLVIYIYRLPIESYYFSYLAMLAITAAIASRVLTINLGVRVNHHDIVHMRENFDKIRELFEESKKVIRISILNLIVGSMDKILVVAILGMSIYGNYTLAMYPYVILYMVTSSAMTVMYPEIVEARINKHVSSNLKNKLFRLYKLYLFPLSLLSIFFLEEAYSFWVSGFSFIEITPTIYILIFAGLVKSINSVLYSFIIAKNQGFTIAESIYLKVFLISIAIYLSVLPFFSIDYVALAVLIIEVITMFIFYFATKLTYNSEQI